MSPRDGSNVYHRPPGTDAVPNTTIASTAYNTSVADVEQDLNLPRPIVAGGTGASTAAAALVALNGEQAKQVITNFDSAVWAAGSFYAATTATGSPVAGHAFAGIAYYANATDFVVEAIDLTDAAHQTYARIMSGGVWGSFAVMAGNIYSSDTPPVGVSDNSLWWESDTGNLYVRYNDGDSTQWVVAVAAPSPDVSGLVAKTGDTMTGPLVLSGLPASALQAASKSYVDGRAVIPRGYLSGLTLSTAGSSTTFSVAAGMAADSTSADMMLLNASIAKTTAVWALGTGVGALDTGAIAASTWYHVFLIKRTDTNVVDVLISLSATAPTLPASYTLFRRVGSMKTNASSQWTKFVQNGDQFLWDVPVGDLNAVALPATSTLYVLSVPPVVGGVDALFFAYIVNNAGLVYCTFSSPQVAVPTINAPLGNLALITAGTNMNTAGQFSLRTDSSAQIRAISSIATGTSFSVATIGWVDRRGRDA